MNTFLVAMFVASIGCLAYVLWRGRNPGGGSEVHDLKQEVRSVADRVAAENMMLVQRLEGIDDRLARSQATHQDLFQGVFDTLGDVRRATSQVADQAKEFTALQDLLRAPKARGGLGEAMLEELLRQVLPPQAYATQHRFSNGLIVDAIVRAAGRIVCIDSKFPLANYQRMCNAEDESEKKDAERAFAADVDRHIRDISTRYIVPDEQTLDFAVMYVPAEGVYAEVLRLAHRKRPLFETAIEHRVTPMSPLTMYGYLQTVMFGLKCLQIGKNAEAILGFCGRLQQDLARFSESYKTLGGHLARARGQYEEGSTRLDRFSDRLGRVTEMAEGPDDERPALEVVSD